VLRWKRNISRFSVFNLDENRVLQVLTTVQPWRSGVIATCGCGRLVWNVTVIVVYLIWTELAYRFKSKTVLTLGNDRFLPGSCQLTQYINPYNEKYKCETVRSYVLTGIIYIYIYYYYYYYCVGFTASPLFGETAFWIKLCRTSHYPVLRLETVATAFRWEEMNVEYEGPRLEEIIFVYSCAE
jgi:hypothetical protein